MLPLPNMVQPFTDAARRIAKPWNYYLQQFTQRPPAFMNVIGASPFSYIAKEPGYLIATGGTITALHLIRGSDDIDLTGQKIIPVSIEDTVIFTYSVLPTIRFVPIYGANTTK